MDAPRPRALVAFATLLALLGSAHASRSLQATNMTVKGEPTPSVSSAARPPLVASPARRLSAAAAAPRPLCITHLTLPGLPPPRRPRASLCNRLENQIPIDQVRGAAGACFLALPQAVPVSAALPAAPLRIPDALPRIPSVPPRRAVAVRTSRTQVVHVKMARQYSDPIQTGDYVEATGEWLSTGPAAQQPVKDPSDGTPAVISALGPNTTTGGNVTAGLRKPDSAYCFYTGRGTRGRVQGGPEGWHLGKSEI